MHETFVSYLPENFEYRIDPGRKGGEDRDVHYENLKKSFILEEESVMDLNGIQQESHSKCPSYREDNAELHLLVHKCCSCSD